MLMIATMNSKFLIIEVDRMLYHLGDDNNFECQRPNYNHHWHRVDVNIDEYRMTRMYIEVRMTESIYEDVDVYEIYIWWLYQSGTRIDDVDKCILIVILLV
jgi:hypothetical protein